MKVSVCFLSTLTCQSFSNMLFQKTGPFVFASKMCFPAAVIPERIYCLTDDWNFIAIYMVVAQCLS